MESSLEKEYSSAKRRSAKPMLWVSMISMTMMFAGLTSAYIVSRKRDDWVAFDLPEAFYLSTALIVLSSVTFFLAKMAVRKNRQARTTLLLLLTLALGIGFTVLQFRGFGELMDAGLYFTGTQSTVKSSFIFGVTGAHLAHIFAGIIVLLVVVYRQLKGKYSSDNSLGLELGEIFWHFVDILWVCLFLFFFFYR